MGEGVHVCGYVRCGRAFAAPLRLTDFSHRPRLETYFACPYCFSKVDDSEVGGVAGFGGEVKLLQGGGFEVPERVGAGGRGLKHGEHKKSDGAGSEVNCPHELGYLKTRSKDEAFPDGCLTCPRILQCMV